MTVTERTRIDGRLLEETPVACPIFRTPWGYRSTGPYRLQRRRTDDPPNVMDVWNTAEHVEVAVGLFCGAAIPLQRETTVVLMDESFRCILGFTSSHGGLKGVGMCWWATAETWAVLERWADIDPMELAVWESLARRYVE